MLLSSLAVAAGLVLLVWSADRFVAGASSIAAHRGASPLLIGIVIVGFGTSAPELTVSALAALQGSPELALGNAWGSNIVNIGLILGVTALIAPLAVHADVIRREMPVLLGATLLAVALVIDLDMQRWEAALLMLAFAGAMTLSIQAARADPGAVESRVPDLSPRASIVWTVVGLILLVAASRLLVWGAVRLAEGFGISELIIGLTVVAVGTSLPELASSLVAVRRGEHDLALGNIIGSNLFNGLAVVGLAILIAPADLPRAVLWRDMPVMLGLTVALFVMMLPLRRRGEGRINRIEGAALLATWILYTGWLVLYGSGAA